MEIKRVDGYYKHGMSFTGKLAVIDYQEDMKNDPRYGQWNTGLDFNYSAKALELVKGRYPGCEVLLAIPDVVVRIEQDQVEKQLYTVTVFDEGDLIVDAVQDVLAWNRREAYFEVMNKLSPHARWEAEIQE